MNVLSNRDPLVPRTGFFGQAEWNLALQHLAEVIGDEAQYYANIPAAKLFAAIPYLAGSEDPDRFAVSNLLTFHGATKARSVFGHRPSDDVSVERRLACFHVGSEADPIVVRFGMVLLCRISLGDHEHDQAADAAAGKYNPVLEGVWDLGAKRAELDKELEDPDMRRLFTEAVSPLDTQAAFWS